MERLFLASNKVYLNHLEGFVAGVESIQKSSGIVSGIGTRRGDASPKDTTSPWVNNREEER